MLNVYNFGATGDGVTDDTAAIQMCINQAFLDKTYVYAPGGDFLCDTLIMPFTAAAGFTRGNYLEGDGMGNTRFIAKNPTTTLFNYIQPAAANFQLGGKIEGCTISGGAKAVNSQAQFSFELNDVVIDGAGIGWNIVNQGTPGDNDACNHIILNNSRIINCSQWGIKTDVRTGNNETSFISVRDSTIENCGTLAGAMGGGMYWRGQVLQFDNSAFVLNNNRGLYIEGGAGLGSNILANSLCFENNRGIHLQCYGLTGMEFHQLQMYSNNANIAQYGMWLNAQSYIGQVRVHSAKIRATAANNPYTAFMAFGANIAAGTIMADGKQVRWDNWGYPGQTQYSGFTVL